VASYVKKYGVNDRVVSRAIEELVAAGIAEKTVVRDGRGVSRWALRIRLDFREQLATAGQVELTDTMANLALHVLTSDGGEARKGRKKWLTPYNRMLLAALLVRADEAGAVYEVGGSHLRRVAGLSGDGFVSQLSKLQRLGYLRVRIGGVTGRYLFGRSAGAYFVNVGHPDFGGIAGYAYVLVRRENWFDKTNKQQAARALYLEARTVQRAKVQERRRNRSRGDELERAMIHRWGGCQRPGGKPLHHFFSDEPVSQFSAYLQMLICRYASLIVNTCLREGYCDSQSRAGELQTKMRNDLESGFESADGLESVLIVVTRLSIQKAMKAWEALCHDDESRALAKSGMACVILPPLDIYEPDVNTVVVLYSSDVPNLLRGHCSILTTTLKFSIERSHLNYGAPQDLGEELSLDNEQALKWRLRSVGKRYPKRGSSLV